MSTFAGVFKLYVPLYKVAALSLPSGLVEGRLGLPVLPLRLEKLFKVIPHEITVVGLRAHTGNRVAESKI